MRKGFLALFFSGYLLAGAQQLAIIPQPVSLQKGDGNFTLSPDTHLVLQTEEAIKSAHFLNAYLLKFYGFQLPVAKSGKGLNDNCIVLSDKKGKSTQDAYWLTVTGKQININAGNGKGIFYGIQSLIQLLPPEKVKSLIIPQVSIVDSARFAYRGMHLDVGRHFLPLSFVKKYIDFIAMHKMNTFHWHLTEDQGWRIEIKKYPKLTQVGAYRNGTIIGHYPGTGNDGEKEGGFYTQKEIKELVKYAADRYITVIPEIEMPGHSSAAIAAYPALSCFPEEATKHPAKSAWVGSTEGKQVQQTWGVFEDVFAPTAFTFKFLEDVLDEVMELFPSKYIHIGGDECPKESWKRSAFCQQLIKEKGLKDEHGLQSYFIQRIEKYHKQ